MVLFRFLSFAIFSFVQLVCNATFYVAIILFFFASSAFLNDMNS